MASLLTILLVTTWLTVTLGFAHRARLNAALQRFLPIVQQRVTALLDWTVCRHLTYDNHSRPGSEEAVQLLTIVLAGVVAFSAYVFNDPKPSALVAFIYLVTSAFPISGFLVLIRSKQVIAPQKHAFDRPTVLLSWILGFGSLLVVIGTAGLYGSEQLLGQKPRDALKVVKAEEYTFQASSEAKRIRAKDSGVQISFLIPAANTFADPFEVQVQPAKDSAFRIVACNVIDTENGQRLTPPPAFYKNKDEQYRIFVYHLQPRHAYELRLLMHDGTGAREPATFLANEMASKFQPVSAYAYLSE